VSAVRTRSRQRLQDRRNRARKTAPRGRFCEGVLWSGDWFGARCPYLARWLQRQNDIYICGVHRRAYLDTVPKEEA
jgi:hypothetical protein